MKLIVVIVVASLLSGACATTVRPTFAEKAPVSNSPQKGLVELKPGVYAVLKGQQAWVTWVLDISAVEVGLGGNFEHWDPSKVVLLSSTKSSQGELWSVTLPFSPRSVIFYKYYVNGMWKEDPHAPLAVNDGYGGHEGKVVVADLLAKQDPALAISTGN